MFFSTLLLAAAITAPFDPNVLSTLSSKERDTFTQIAGEEFCGCDSALTLQGCLNGRPSCKQAFDLADVLLRAVRTGAPRQSVAAFMSQGVLGPYCSLPQTLDVAGAPRRGPANAPLQVVEFADFRCTHCRQAMPLVHAAIDKLGGKASLVYMPVALVDPSPSSATGEAALAAHAQGKYWAMHKLLFNREAGDYTPEVLRTLAKAAGLDLKRFDADMAGHVHQAQLKAFRARFVALGLEGTPAMFVNGRRFDIEPNIFTLEDRLTLEMDRNAGECK